MENDVAKIEICLNPFEIRASVQRNRGRRGVPCVCGLNPFEIRASVQPKDAAKDAAKAGLNPFEIRASVQHMYGNDREQWAKSQSL